MDASPAEYIGVTYLAGFAPVVTPDGEHVLLLRSSADSALWKFPGGVIRSGESAITGVQREVREELACDLHVGATLVTRLEKSIAGNSTFGVLYVPTTASVGFSPRLSTEHDAYRWTLLSDLEHLEIDSHLGGSMLVKFIRELACLCRDGFGSHLEAA